MASSTNIQYPVPKQSIRFVPEIAALDTAFLLRPLDGKAVSAFHDLFNGYGYLTSNSYSNWWVHPWDAEHESDDEDEDYVTREQWDAMYACAKAVGLEDGQEVIVDVTW